MLICNGCSKTGTHLLTAYAKEFGLKQCGGTLVKRKPEAKLNLKSKSTVKELLQKDNTHFIHAHTAYEHKFAERRLVDEGHKMLHIIRNPRDVAVSWMRHRNRQNSDFPVNKDQLIDVIEKNMFGMGVIGYYSGFLGWLDNSDTLNIRFEEALNDRANTLERIGHYLGISKDMVDLNSVYGNSSTYTGSFSKWSEFWDDEVEAVWEATGGYELESILGYTNQ